MTMPGSVVASLISPAWFQLVMVGSQVLLIVFVIVLLGIWWVEWRNGRVW